MAAPSHGRPSAIEHVHIHAFTRRRSGSTTPSGPISVSGLGNVSSRDPMHNVAGTHVHEHEDEKGHVNVADDESARSISRTRDATENQRSHSTNQTITANRPLFSQPTSVQTGHAHPHRYDSRNPGPEISSPISPGMAQLLPSNRPVPAPLTTLEGWKTEITPGGRTVISTPTNVKFVRAYSDPHVHRPTHGVHDHCSDKSWFTSRLLAYTTGVPVLHSIIVEKDSRRIAYFMTLNFSFMVVQAFYGYVTESLGLLSDSVHMFFDCVALAVGLLAAVLSKRPPSRRFPYGFGKIEALSGFANGVLLMLLSVEITFEAFERIWEGAKPKRLGELFVVSTLGLVINWVGMMAFGHHHHHHHHHHGHSGDDGDHSHGHSHQGRTACGNSGSGHGHGGHAHHHDNNENMHGIYLHVLADTLGSVSVIISTALTHFTGWPFWDPLASCVIAILIFLSSRPLVMSCSRRLLLSIPHDAEYTLRNTLAGIMNQRGVVGYAVPKFWVDDRSDAAIAAGKQLVEKEEAYDVHDTEPDSHDHHHHEHEGHNLDHGQDSDHNHNHGCGSGDVPAHGKMRILGVVHVLASRIVSSEDVRDRVRAYLFKEGLDVVVQVEKEGDGTCWCGVGRGPGLSPLSKVPQSLL